MMYSDSVGVFLIFFRCCYLPYSDSIFTKDEKSIVVYCLAYLTCYNKKNLKYIKIDFTGKIILYSKRSFAKKQREKYREIE